MAEYNKVGNIIGMVIIILVIILLCCCIDFSFQGVINRGNTTVFDNTITNLYNTVILNNNGKGNITLYNGSNIKNNKLNNLSNQDNNHENKTYIEYPKIINYTILEYGKYSKEDREYYYSYIDKLRNKTIIFIYGGKRPVDYSINIVKIVKNNNNDASIYVERVLSSPSNTSDFIITSPYIVLEINGTIKNINIEYIQNRINQKQQIIIKK
ncbi:protease complex subunit PrcB family protein [Methanothermococcus sp. SCGC AD-155-C09]|nr:protease complex subunit PrcB family protein [Methanothermococcus sp. SCGC AD-155-C09]